MTKGFLRRSGDDFLVGAEDRQHAYAGPVARVYHDKTWIHINTDDYEGNAMLNIEALPSLRRALAAIAKRIRIASQENA